MRLRIAFLVLCVIGSFLWLIKVAGGQSNHAQHHDAYKNWTNKLGQGCCNNQDCGELSPQDERTSAGKLEVRIEGEWCPVLPHHYLKTGNAPNGSTSHVCVLLKISNAGGPCERFICYQPQALY